MLKIALQYREVVDVIVDHKKAGLRKFELQDEEWDSLSDLFKLYKDLTLKFSLEGIATIAHVLPCMDKIVNMLEDAADDPDINIAVVAALQGGVDLMNKYYEKSDDSHAYRIGMGYLHPGIKMKYFVKHEWPQDWIEEVRDIVRGVYTT
ncbi:hypothetical protein C8R43DRAFT_865891, partial [Mycena crocata]